VSEALPLFPLRATLMPGGRIPLQIFEPRYLDLVSRCMKGDSGFGVLRITAGHEVVIAQGNRPPAIAEVGTLARIVDWDALPQGRLRITIEGSRRFRVLSSRTLPDHLLSGDVDWIDDAPSAPLGEEHSHLLEIMAGLVEHPALARLGVNAKDLDSGRLAYLLAQYLPLDEEDRYAVLLESDLSNALERIDRIVREMAEGK
jgi:uncharacterized protein